jgi:hypothetical protein
VCCVFRQIAKIDQRQRPRRRGHEKMLRHGSRPAKGSWILRRGGVAVYAKCLIPLLGEFAS